MIHVFIVGSKGIPAQYGGFETFVENLTARKVSNQIQYHVSCMDNNEGHFMHNGADCFKVRVPMPGAPGRILHVGLVLQQVEKWVTSHPNEKTIVYILGCRIGPLLIPHARKLHLLGVKVYCNPDGLEWKRSKWSKPAKLFLRFCEKCLVENSDMAICDSQTIEEYIKDTYGKRVRNTTYIAYGADVKASTCSEAVVEGWYKKFHLQKNGYYLIVGRFVPENNYETMITEFQKSETKRDLVIITNVEKNKFYEQLREKTQFDQDKRIKFVGTVYEAELLKKIREGAYAYMHGHEVGGTNPSLLEALASTRINLLLAVGFNQEVARESALYWSKQQGNLAALIDSAEQLPEERIQQLDESSTLRVLQQFSWDKICANYEELFAIGDC